MIAPRIYLVHLVQLLSLSLSLCVIEDGQPLSTLSTLSTYSVHGQHGQHGHGVSIFSNTQQDASTVVDGQHGHVRREGVGKTSLFFACEADEEVKDEHETT